MTQLTYAGIGSRQTPRGILDIMTRMATWLAGQGWYLHSGGAKGADTAFADGAPVADRTQFLPWVAYQRSPGVSRAAPREPSRCRAVPSGAPMIPVLGGVRVSLASGVTDMRRGMNTLAAVPENESAARALVTRKPADSTASHTRGYLDDQARLHLDGGHRTAGTMFDAFKA